MFYMLIALVGRICLKLALKTDIFFVDHFLDSHDLLV